MLECLISCTLHTLKENGVRRYNNSISEQHGVKEKDEEKKKRACVKDGVSWIRDRHLGSAFSLCVLYICKKLLALYDVLQSLQIRREILLQPMLERMSSKSVL